MLLYQGAFFYLTKHVTTAYTQMILTEARFTQMTILIDCVGYELFRLFILLFLLRDKMLPGTEYSHIFLISFHSMTLERKACYRQVFIGNVPI